MLLWFFMLLVVWTNSIKFTFIFSFINHSGVRFLLELNVNYPFSSKEKFSRSCRLPIFCWLRLWITHLLSMSYFITFIMSTSMEEVLAILRNLDQENEASTSLGCILATQPQPKKPWINLVNKFDGIRSKFRSYVNQMHLIIWLHLHRYATGPVQVGFTCTLLSNTALSWFAPLLEHQSPLFNDFEMFIEKFDGTFGDSDKKHTSNIKCLVFIILYFLKSCLHPRKKFLCPWKKSLLSFIIYNKKSNISWIYCSFLKQSSFDVFGMHFHDQTLTKAAMNKFSWQVWWLVIKVLRFCQLNVLSPSTFSSSIFSWPNLSWIPQQSIVKHYLCLVYTFIGMLITFI